MIKPLLELEELQEKHLKLVKSMHFALFSVVKKTYLRLEKTVICIST